MRRKKFLLPVLFIFIATSASEAAGIQVSPSDLTIEVAPGGTAKANIAVKNTSSEVALYQVYVDTPNNLFTLSPQSFIVEGGKTQNVSIEVAGKENGVFSTTISVVGGSLTQRDIKMNVGVKIPLQVRISMNWQGKFLASVSQNLKNLFSAQNLIVISMFLLFISWIYIFMLRKKITR